MSSSAASNKRKRSTNDFTDGVVGVGAGVHATVETLGNDGGDDGKKTSCDACKTDIPCHHPGVAFFQLRGKCAHGLCSSCIHKAHCERCKRAWNECLVCPVTGCDNNQVRDYVGFTTAAMDDDGQLRVKAEEYEIHVPLTLSHLDGSLIAKIFTNLDWKDIIKLSITCKDIHVACKGMIYEAEMKVESERTANNLANIGKAFKIQRLRIERPNPNLALSWEEFQLLIALREIHDDSIIAGEGHSNRERREEGTVDLNASLSALPDLRSLCITQNGPILDGFYPSIAGLAKLQMIQLNSGHLRMDLASFEAMPHLVVLDLAGCRKVSGNLTALKHLKQTLILLNLRECRSVRGNLGDLSGFKLLAGLDLSGTTASGSILNVRPSDFPNLGMLYLKSASLHGSHLESIVDAGRLMTSWYHLMRLPGCLLHKFGQTSDDDWEWEVRWNGSHFKHKQRRNGIIGRWQVPRYEYNPVAGYEPPRCLKMIRLAGVVGYRFGCTRTDESKYVSSGANDCDVVWLDHEPKPGDKNFRRFDQLRRSLSRTPSVFSGLTAPPVTREEYIAFLREKGVDFIEENV